MTDIKTYDNWRRGEMQTQLLAEVIAEHELTPEERQRFHLRLKSALGICQWCGVREAAPNDARGACTECDDLLASCC